MKHTHAEGPGSIQISRFARGMFPLVAAFLAFALAAPEARAAAPADFAKKMTLTPSETALAKIGETAWTDFPVLVRLPAEASALLQSANGTDLLFTDENDATLPFEVETFNPDGTTFVWVKVPSLSSATRLTVYFGGSANADNDPTAVWSRYVGVWHFAADAAGTTTVADATGHALDATTAGDLTAVDGPFGDRCLRSSASTSAPDFEPGFAVGATFTASGWFKAPEMTTSDYVSPAKKKGSKWDAANGWYLELPKKTDKLQIILTGNTPSTTLSDVRSNWHYFEVVSGGGSVKVYLDGATSPKISSTYTIVANSERYSIQAPKMLCDEYRIRKGAASADETALEYATMADAAFFGLGAIEPVDATAQEFETPTAVRNADGTYTVTVVLSENSGDVGVFYDAGETAVTNILATAANPGTFTDTPANLTLDTTYKFAAYGKNANGTKVIAKGGVFYNGEISIEKISDANENGLVTGVFRISRADTAHDLAVAYTVSGTAAAGQTYAALSGTATIPAGSTSVDVEVVPLLDAATTEDKTVALTLATGLYGINAQAGSAEMTVVNLVVPSGYNVWVAPADGLASVDSNWSAGHAPISTEQVLFDGRFSTANCEWDAAATPTVASWTQTEGYTGKVSFDTTYSGVFPVFTVTGDATLNAGSWSHPLSFTTTSSASNDDIKSGETYRLNVAVGGTLTIGSGGSINVVGKGVKQTAGSSPIARHGGSVSSSGACYGNPKYPVDVGSAAWSGTDQDAKKAAGGGAVHIVAGTAVVVDGAILADGESKAYACGAGGSILVEAPSVTGSGTIRAGYTYATGNANSVLTGAGGRVALITTTAIDLATLSVSAAAYATGGNMGSGGAGTVYLKDSTMMHGVLVVDNPKETSKKDGGPRTGVTTEGDWTFDEVRLGGWCQLVIPDGATLHLPNGLASVTALSDAAAASSSIYVTAGTLDIGASATQTMRGKWELAVYTNLVFDCSLSLEQGAMLGRHNRSATIANGADVATYDTFVCAISVAGDLTVDSTSSLSVRQSGFGQHANNYFPGYGTGSHGGCYGTSSLTDGSKAYGSILNPLLPARFQSNSYYQPGGGVLKLTVGGTLTLNGEINSDGYSGGNKGVRGAGGSINVTAGALAGSGAIHADGYSVESGGRVAVRLTGAGATFGDFSGRISARRDTTSSSTLTAPGTVYLQTAAQGEGCGTILVDGTPRSGTAAFLGDPYTPIPANGAHADDPADLKKCSLEVSNYASIGIAETLKLASLETDSSSIIDLNGKTLTVNAAKVNGVRLAPGTYGAGSDVAIGERTLGDYLVDTAEDAGGALVVSGGGFMLLVR